MGRLGRPSLDGGELSSELHGSNVGHAGPAPLGRDRPAFAGSFCGAVLVQRSRLLSWHGERPFSMRLPSDRRRWRVLAAGAGSYARYESNLDALIKGSRNSPEHGNRVSFVAGILQTTDYRGSGPDERCQLFLSEPGFRSQGLDGVRHISMGGTPNSSR